MTFLPWTFALILNAVGYPGLQKLDALGFRFRLEMVGTAVLGACRAPLEKPPIGEFIKGFIIRVNIRRSAESREAGSGGLIISASPLWKCTAAAPEPFVCGIVPVQEKNLLKAGQGLINGLIN